ncbi:biotin transporter BioY [Pararhodospirillum oryzae]|uniref:Biotin transporter n=1 Tax=Pararhodospirillum oryzae TaxID=478448 RepID=A0A512HBP4_9PROT|nr:biotin transporter BioY [Pararhodospirillum oryzae]GEO82862.1 biotin biosynthesis protein BioY [Pararhodospirillum oryzae]
MLSCSLSRGAAPVRSWSTSFAFLIAGVALLTLGAKTQIPFWPVPMTLHTLVVMALAVAAGPRLAVATFVAYLGVGALGLPVFSGTPERGLGLAYMAGPTGGYLMGYLVASGLVGFLAAGRGFVGRLGAMLAGLVAIYALGVAGLIPFVPTSHLFTAGVAPFLVADLIKVLIVAVGASAVSRLREVRS